METQNKNKELIDWMDKIEKQTDNQALKMSIRNKKKALLENEETIK